MIKSVSRCKAFTKCHRKCLVSRVCLLNQYSKPGSFLGRQNSRMKIYEEDRPGDEGVPLDSEYEDSQPGQKQGQMEVLGE